MQIEGSCHCGQITFTAEVNPEQVLICHCTDCQTLSSSAYRTVVPAIEGTFEIQKGTLKKYVKTAESGAKRAQCFCPDCGTQIYAGPDDENSSFVGIRVGSIKQRDQLKPTNQIWCRSAQNWTQDLSDVNRLDKQPALS